MERELRIALAGCGRLAEVGHIPALHRAAGVRLAAVAEPDAARRRRLASQAPGAASLARLLEQQEVDAVVLATPAEAHLEDARRAAERGLPALVEKPPAPDAEQAAALAALDPAPFIGFNRRFDPGLAALRPRVAAWDGHLELDAVFRYRRRAWSAYAVRDDVLLDLGPHLLDLMLWLSGRAALEVRVRMPGATRAELELRLERGHARLRLAGDLPYREAVVVRAIGAGGARGRGTGGRRSRRRGRVIARRRSGGPLAGVRTLAGVAGSPGGGGHPLVASLTAELEAFARAVAGGEAWPLASARDGAAAMATIDAARASAAARGAWVPVSRPAAAPPAVPAGGRRG